MEISSSTYNFSAYAGSGQASTQTQQTQLQAMINLYKAMGGGWVIEAEKMSAPTAPVRATESNPKQP